MKLKIEGVFVVLAKTCFEKFAPKVRRIFHNLLPVKSLVRHCLQTTRRVDKISFNVYLYSAKISFRYFDPFQREQQP